MQANQNNQKDGKSETLAIQPASHHDIAAVIPRQGVLSAFGKVICVSWMPRPIPKPEINPELTSLSSFERVAEVIRYHLLCLEYWISSGGILREYLKFNLGLFILIAIPTVLILPIITLALSDVKTWAELIFQTVQYILFALIYVILIVFIFAVMVFGLREYSRKRKQSR